MGLASLIQENGGLGRGGLIGAFFGKNKSAESGSSCEGGSCGSESQASACGPNGCGSGGSNGPSNQMLAKRPGSTGCTSDSCG